MKKNKLDSKYEVDFELLGLVCNKKEYKLAWHLNESLRISLIKQKDIRIDFSDNTSILISNFLYKADHQQIELLQNRLLFNTHPKYKFLLPELNQFDYLLKIGDEVEELNSENVSVIIKEIPIVEYVMRFNFDNLKSKDNLLY
ncbi:MAG: IPExxxVDY family protein [Ekhidna sp.]|nr:IPExxxVDY family protein [Ekhidna sp.]MBC6410779.1 IPExxxVDY family protein [Ekhidna sp.]MBC6425360.1 IPExxxVDY family protein [Ekhidna sp.]